MVIYLYVTGVMSLFFGLILLFTPNFFKKICLFFDRIVFKFDEKIMSYKASVGIVLIMVAGWLFYMTTRYPEISPIIHPFWIIILIFGIFYLFFPGWMAWLSNITDRNIFLTNEYVLGASRIFGAVFIIVGIYILFGAYRIARPYLSF
jgi:hypothetical protein